MKEPCSDASNELEKTRIEAPAPVAALVQGAVDAAPAPNPFDKVRYFGTYELVEEIARGGMGVVYKARQATLKRTVAIKVILSGQLATEKEIRRFLMEAEAAANLNHPGIVPVYEFGEHDGMHYFSMAFVDGPSLAEKVADGPLEPARAVDLLHQISEAVAYAHEQGVVHRDLKPSNILLEGGEHPRIADFGLAKRMEEDTELTNTGTIMGSVHYMSPEQAGGRTGEVGPASDVYALGAILYKLLTGRPPFQAATGFETMQQVLHEEPVPPRQLNSSIPRDLETVCLKCLEKDIGRRYKTAVELTAELDRLRAGLPILARPIGRLARFGRWYLRNPVAATLAAGLVAALFAGALVATTLWNRARAEHQRAQDRERVVQVLSGMVLEKSLDETGEWLRQFFQPVEQELLVARAWGAAGLLDKEDPDRLNALLGPLIALYPQLSSLLVGDSLGREHMLLCIEQANPDTGIIERLWKNRITRRNQWGDRVRWVEWSDDDPVPRESFREMPDYDPRNRPWYQDALAQPAPRPGEALANAVHWTAPYQFFTTQDPGITASVRFDRGDGLDHVVAFDVLLDDITEFTFSKQPTQNGKVLVLSQDQRLIGLPQEASLGDRDDWKEVLLKHPGDVGLVIITRALELLNLASAPQSAVLQFEESGRRWWAGVRPFKIGASGQLWILVIVPESDLREDLVVDAQVE